MSSPIIWILFPLAISIVLWFIQIKTRLVFSIALTVCLLLGLAALFQPIGGIIKIGPTSVEIKDTLFFFGRNFTLQNSDRFFLAFIYFSAIFWVAGSRMSAAPSKFIPLGLAIISLLTAALAVDPFLYSAVIIELVVIISLPLLLNRGEAINKGVLRYLIYQSLAMPFILFAGWILSGAQANSSDISQLNIAALLLGLGFAFLMAVFPFHVWVPEIASESHSYTSGFLLSTLPPVYLLIMLKFLNGLVWLKDATFLTPVLQTTGVLMIVTAGLWAATQTNLKRLFGFVVIMESGFSLLCISFHSQQGNELFYLSLIPHMLTLGVFAFILAYLQRHELSSDLAELKGQIKNHPVVFTALICVLFSIIGIPLFAGFPLKMEAFELLPPGSSLLIWLLLGYAGMLFASFRLLVSLIGNTSQRWSLGESTGDLFFLVTGVFILVLMGIFPSVFIGGIWRTFASLLTLT